MLARWRSSEQAVGVLVVDLDSFKNLNDLFGHPEGDATLRVTADRMLAILPEDHLLARIGGDEFAILLPVPQGCYDSLDAVGTALVEVLAASVENAGVEVPLSASVGGALDASGQDDLRLMFKRADDAMYGAKGKGRCRYCAFTTDMARAMAEREAMEVQLRRALLVGELYPVYEPLVDLKSGKNARL